MNHQSVTKDSDTLAIFTPNLGAVSEVFIKNHIINLHNNTVVIADSNYPPYSGHWDIDYPKLILRQKSLSYKLVRKILQKIDFQYSFDKVKIKTFLKNNQVTRILSEFLDFSTFFLSFAQDLDIPFYTHAHGIDISHRLRSAKWRKRYLRFEAADGIITMSEFSQQKLIGIGLPSEKIHIVPYGVTVLNQPLPKKNLESNRCLAVGRMVAKKAPLLLLESFYKVLQIYPQARLDYIGTGPLMSYVEKFILDFNMSDKVTLHGAKPHAFVIESMLNTDIFIQHSITDPITGDAEGLPVAILEAMGCAKPVVSTIHAGIPEAVLDGKTGFLVKEGDTKAMADRIITLFECVHLCQSMGFQGWERAKNLFSWEQEKQKLRKIMRLN